MNNFGHIEAMKVNFFEKCWKFKVNFETAIKVPENIDGFEENIVWTCSPSVCQLLEEYMGWSINVLRSGPKISDWTKRHDT